MSSLKFICGLFFVIPTLLVSQVNNSEYKKTFYNENLIPTDSINSIYWGFDLYHNDTLVYWFNKGKKDFVLFDKKETYNTGSPIILNGVIELVEKINSHTSIKQTRVYKDGYPIHFSSKRFCKKFNKTPCFDDVINFKKKYKNQLGSYFGYTIQNNRKIKKYWFCFDKTKWNWKYK